MDAIGLGGAYLVNSSASEYTHDRDCMTASKIWKSLKAFYELEGEITVSNATAQFSAIIMAEPEDITDYGR